MKIALRVVSMVLACLIPASASAVPDPNAAVVLLRQHCGDPALENCFESMSALADWIWEMRQPSASARLLVDIGPGVFGPFTCGDGETQNLGYVTLRGSGREQTILKGTNPLLEDGIVVLGCNDLSFIDLGAHGRYGATWFGGGTSSWSNVDLVGMGSYAAAGWYDAGCSGSSRGVHYFHGSRIRAVPSGNVLVYVSAFTSLCSESWIFGGELFVDAFHHTGTIGPQVVRIDGGFVETFGTAIRGKVSGSGTGGGADELVGVLIRNTSSSGLPVAFHSHGVNIGLSTNTASETNLNVVAITASNDVVVHSLGTAYALTPGSGATATRIRVTGGAPKPKVEAPYHWSAAANPPEVTSRNGQDIFVETDCTSTGCTGGTEPHLMIYAPTACTSGSPWWDVSRNACRVP